ncbi:S9 family peptidase [uncultured Fretibacterium sp.]|uniref:alpha/beta hydrolase family protein n=2 Tax=uncultured Fretibacterium sp. TaxID=1678694 RepID=UPI00261E8998|nr:S9 family peptidase [uncultured Fretibacterium sp.]
MEKHEDKTSDARVVFHDLLRYRFLSAPRFSPDGSRIAFAVHRADLEGNRYLSDLWVYSLNTETCTPLTASGAERAFCWDPSGAALIFVSGRAHQPAEGASSGPDADPDARTARIYSIPVTGGEARLLAEVPREVTELWALDEGRLLLWTVDPREPERFEDADYRVLEQIPFCTNGKGFTAQSRRTLSLFTPASGELRDLSPRDMEVRRVRLSADRRRALVTGVVYRDVMPETSGVWEFDLESGEMAERVPQAHFAWSCADAFAGGLLLTGTDMKRHGHNENVRFYLAGDGAPKCLTPELDRGLRNSVICDCRYGLTDQAQAFRVDGDRAWFVSTDGYRSHLHTVDAHGGVVQVSQELRSIEDYDVRDGRAAVVGLEGLGLQELYLVEAGRERRLTDFNAAALEGKDLSVPEYVRLENGTPEGLDCWYMRPVGFEVGKKYPTLLHIHGGPKMTFGDVFVHEMQCWAAEGFAVLFCNPRGSDGKGNAFADIRGRYGTVDYEDLMAFVDWASDTLPFVDRDRLGVTGGSYGGFMTNWIVGRTDRFRAAVTQRSICNWVSMAGITDIGYFFVPDQQAADIWSGVDELWNQSPLKYADQARTPTLIIHSDEDHRCELSQGLQFFTALRRNGVEARLCVFKGENHELSRSGRPRPRLARMREIVRWFVEKV